MPIPLMKHMKNGENGYTPDHTGEWEDGDDNEIFLVNVFPIREDSE